MSEFHVVFGSGPLGKWTARALQSMGKQVRMINRSGQASGLPAGVDVVKGDALNIPATIELTRGAAAFYQCAQPHYYDWVDKFPPMQAAILEAAAANSAKLIAAENLYMYGKPNGLPMKEDSPIQPCSRKGKVRAEMSAALMEAHQAGKVRAAVGRASDFFGPDDKALTGYAIRPALQGKAVNLLGRTDMLHTFTYIADFGRLLAELGTRDEALGQVWFAPSSPAITQNELVQMISEEIGKPVKTMVGSPFILTIMGIFNKELRETVEMLYEWTEPFVMDSGKAEKAFNLQATPLKQALKETLAWYQSEIDRK